MQESVSSLMANPSCESTWADALCGAPEKWRFTPVGDQKIPVDVKTGHPAKHWTINHVSLDDLPLKTEFFKAVGLVLGTASGGVLAVDFDGPGHQNTFLKAYGRAVDDLPLSISWTSGREGRHQVAYQVPYRYWARMKGKHQLKLEGCGMVELLWDGHQSVVTGQHPTTDGYRWINSPADTPLADAPEWLLEPLFKTASVNTKPTNTGSDASITDAWRARQFLIETFQPAKNFADHDTWLEIGMALRWTSDQTGNSNLLLEDFVNWSSQMGDVFDEDECLQRWDTWGADGDSAAITFNSLVHRVQSLGGDTLNAWDPVQASKSGKGFLARGHKAQQRKKSLDEFRKAFGTVSNRSKDRSGYSTDRKMDVLLRYIRMATASERNSLRRTVKIREVQSNLGLSTQYLKSPQLAQLVMEAQDFRSGNVFRPLTVEDRLAMAEPTLEWLVDGVIPFNDCTVVGGLPKVGKTRLVTDLVRSILTGSDFLGFPTGKQDVPVVYVSDDQSDADTVQFFKQAGIWSHPKLLWSSHFRTTERDLDRLLDTITDNPGALVVIDSLRSVSRSTGIEENSSEIGPLIYDLKTAVTDAGGSLLIIHHCNKRNDAVGTEALSGHTSIASAANTVLTFHYIDNRKGAPERRLVREARSGDGFDLVLDRHPEIPGRFSKRGTYLEFLRSKGLQGFLDDLNHQLNQFPELEKVLRLLLDVQLGDSCPGVPLLVAMVDLKMCPNVSTVAELKDPDAKKLYRKLKDALTAHTKSSNGKKSKSDEGPTCLLVSSRSVSSNAGRSPATFALSPSGVEILTNLFKQRHGF